MNYGYVNIYHVVEIRMMDGYLDTRSIVKHKWGSINKDRNTLVHDCQSLFKRF